MEMNFRFYRPTTELPTHVQPTSINRKQFLQRAGVLVGAAALPGWVHGEASVEPGAPANLPEGSGSRKLTYRVAGLTDRQYGKGFQRLCRFGRFDSAQAAAASVRNPNTEFFIVCE